MDKIDGVSNKELKKETGAEKLMKRKKKKRTQRHEGKETDDHESMTFILLCSFGLK